MKPKRTTPLTLDLTSSSSFWMALSTTALPWLSIITSVRPNPAWFSWTEVAAYLYPPATTLVLGHLLAASWNSFVAASIAPGSVFLGKEFCTRPPVYAPPTPWQPTDPKFCFKSLQTGGPTTLPCGYIPVSGGRTAHERRLTHHIARLRRTAREDKGHIVTAARLDIIRG